MLMLILDSVNLVSTAANAVFCAQLSATELCATKTQEPAHWDVSLASMEQIVMRSVQWDVRMSVTGKVECVIGVYFTVLHMIQSFLKLQSG